MVSLVTDSGVKFIGYEDSEGAVGDQSLTHLSLVWMPMCLIMIVKPGTSSSAEFVLQVTTNFSDGILIVNPSIEFPPPCAAVLLKS